MKNFGTAAKFKPQPTYFYSVYAYYDLVRERGAGFQYQFLPRYSIDFSVYLINPIKKIILQWDYYDLKGYGFSIRPKYHFSSLGNWYVSPNISFEWLSHGKVWVEQMIAYHEIIHRLEETKGKAFTLGVSFGRKVAIKQIYIEPFIGFGVTDYKGEKTTYQYDPVNPYSTIVYPYKERYHQDFLQLFAGIKFGMSFKKSKKHIAIDKKFDEVYIPKATQLADYFKTLDPKSIEFNKNLRQAYARTKGLNRSVLLRYKNNYGDTVNFYRKVDTLFQKIDLLLIKANQ